MRGWALLIVLFLVCETVRSEGNSSCSTLTGYYAGYFSLINTTGVGHVVPIEAEIGINVSIDKTEKKIHASITHRKVTNPKNHPIYLSISTGIEKIYCNQTKKSCSASYGIEYEDIVVDVWSKNSEEGYPVIYYVPIRHDQFVLKNTTGQCNHDAHQTILWYPYNSPPAKVSWCLCCGDYQSGGGLNCPAIGSNSVTSTFTNFVVILLLAALMMLF